MKCRVNLNYKSKYFKYKYPIARTPQNEKTSI